MTNERTEKRAMCTIEAQFNAKQRQDEQKQGERGSCERYMAERIRGEAHNERPNPTGSKLAISGLQAMLILQNSIMVDYHSNAVLR